MSKTTRTLVAFVAGAAVGATIGILYAPDSGENTRDKLSFRLTKYRDQLRNLIGDLVDGNGLPTEQQSESQQVVTAARERAERLLADVESLMAQMQTS